MTAAEILLAGGTAADAAIAAALMAFVAEPVLASPGGGGFAMLDPGTGRPELWDFFAQTPMRRNPEAGGFLRADADFGDATQSFAIGPAAVAVPGMIPGLLALHKAHARMPFRDLAAPAIAAARSGVEITPFQARLGKIVGPILLAFASGRTLFTPDGQHLPTPGDRMKNPALSGFLADLGDFGAEVYADAVVPAILGSQGEGHLARADFEGYRVERRVPLQLTLGPATVFANPAPAAGGILVAHTLKSLAGDTPLHHAEALAATDRARRAAGTDLGALIARLGPPANRGTTHISVADAKGGAVSLTVTNGEGNGQALAEFGFMPNNMLGEEDVNPFGADGWPENTRLASMMAPTLAYSADGGLIALGSGGSNRIRSAIAQVLAHAVIAGKPLSAAVTAPRVHVENGHIDIEPGFAPAAVATLQKAFADHRLWTEQSMFFGGCHAIARSASGTFAAAGDPRRDGVGRTL